MSQLQESAPRVPSLGEFRLGEWSVRQAEGILSMDGRSVRLEPRVMDVLACLAAEPGRVVSKEDLLAAVWDGAFIDEGGLSQAIHGLRKALGDDARQPRYIQTVPKRGYRLVPMVELKRGKEEEIGGEALSLPAESPAASGSAAPFKKRGTVWLGQVAVVLMITLLLGIVWSRRERQRQASAAVVESGEIRIVVLPFQDVGKPEDPYFAAGLTEEITANLTLLPMMQVIPGRNTLGDDGVTKPISEIGQEFGADYVLQGTVNWLAGRRQLRVIPQLIKVEDGTVTLATPFEGNTRSPFRAQQEISRAVISVMDITLTPEQSQVLGRRSTVSPEAYRAYVEGIVLKDQPFYSPPHLEKAARMFQQAVDTDPYFTEAWAELSQVHSYLAFNTDRSSKRKEQARWAMEKAVSLGPDLVATYLAQAYFAYRCLEDYGVALERLTAVARIAPNIAEALEMHGLILRRLGRLPEAIELLKRASGLKPHMAGLVWTIAESYGALRNYEQADAYFERAISLAPDEAFNYEQRASIRLAWTGNLGEARAILEDSPVRDSPQLQLAEAYFDLYEGKFQQAVTRLSVVDKEQLSVGDQVRIGAVSVVALERLGDPGALALAKANLAILKLRTAQYSRHPRYHAYSAIALAQLGRHKEALSQAEQAVQQSRHDAFSGPRFVEVQAMVNAILGRRTEAVALLRWLLSTPYRDPISTAELRLDPVWDRLRGDQEFEILLRDYEKSKVGPSNF